KWNAEIVKLNELCQPDRQIAEIIKQGQAARREHKCVKEKVEGIQANATKAGRNCATIRIQIAKLAEHSFARKLSRSVAMAGIVGFPVSFASASVIAGIASAFGASVTAFFASR